VDSRGEEATDLRAVGAGEGRSSRRDGRPAGDGGTCSDHGPTVGKAPTVATRGGAWGAWFFGKDPRRKYGAWATREPNSTRLAGLKMGGELADVK